MYFSKDSLSTMCSISEDSRQTRPQNSIHCRFIPSLACFDDVQTMLEASTRENDENQSGDAEPQENAGKPVAQSTNGIFQQILRNNLLEDRPKSLFFGRGPRQRASVWELPPSRLKSSTLIDESFTSERKVPSIPFKVLDAPNLQDDFYLNVVDWSRNDNLAVGLGQAVYVWNFHSNRVRKLTEFFGVNCVSSVSWDPRSDFLGIGTKEGSVSLWDGVKEVSMRKFYDHSERVGALSLFGHFMLTGSKDKNILMRDTRLKNSLVRRFQSHKQEICGLKWSPDGNYFASGGNDNKLCVFSPKTVHPLMKKCHKAAVKAIAWSPRRVGVLASGAGTADKCIRLWNSRTKELLAKTETGSQVCNLVFSKHSDELISSHGFSNNDICIWESRSFRKVKTLSGHLSRVLYLSMSPCGNFIVSGAGDETLRFWNLNYESAAVAGEKSSLASRSKKCKKKGRKRGTSHLEQQFLR